ncbi:MAG TPA: DUF4291 domain-containing protein [Flavipsychrobacter sp.]|nr:DUF4291 domain-containing protein [Flavipsychrobacter sp.]
MLQLESYSEHEHHLPSKGKFIIAQFDKDSIVVYQAFKDSIADYALANQKFGGKDYDFNRMTWLKPSFLWMMYYSGWAKKENQENVLAIRMKREGFDEILSSAVMSTFYKEVYKDNNDWKDKFLNSEIHVQWEHYYDLFGKKTDRYAAKIGIKGEVQTQYNEEWILEIENVTSYVKEQQKLLQADKSDLLQIPHERAYAPSDLTILKKIDATTISL